MPRFAANVSTMYVEHPFLDRFAAAHADGFDAVEFQFPYGFAAADIHRRLTDHGLTPVLFNLPAGDATRGERGLAALGIGHLQIAGVPERYEPDIGEIDYPYLFERIDVLGYEGWVGCEYRPKGRTSDGLGWLSRWRASAPERNAAVRAQRQRR